MIRLVITLVLGITLFSSVNLRAAQPYTACGDCGYGAWGWGGWGGYAMYGHEGLLPHYALYPPVYYSLPVPRTYGYSPFAYPPTVMTPEVSMGDEQPLEIINPYVPSKET